MLSDGRTPMDLHKLCIKDNRLGDQSAILINYITMKSMIRFLDISNNAVVLRFLDNLIVTSGYKFGLEFFGIEGNEKEYKAKKNSWSCIGTSHSDDSRASTSVSQA